MNQKKIQNYISKILQEIGEDLEREGLKKTPQRVARTYMELFSGYNRDPKEFCKVFKSKSNNNQIIKISGIEFQSMCEHHILPFYGLIDIEYKPNKKILGLSKFSRICELYSRKLQIQEKLTDEILHAIVKMVSPKYCKVSISATHLCQVMRGVKKNNSIMTTISEYQAK